MRGSVALGAALQTNTALTALDLSANRGLRTAAAEALATGLQHNHSLAQL